MAAEQQIYYLQLADEHFGDTSYNAGSIWWTFDDSIDLVPSVFLFCNVEATTTMVPVNKDQVLNTNLFAKISYDEHELLVAVGADKRLRIFHNRDWLSEGLEMKMDSLVFVMQGDSRLSGIIRFVGIIGAGRMFGIELDPEFRGQGTSNGTFRKMNYFKCEEDCAMFCNLYKLRLKDRNSLRLRRSAEENLSPVEFRASEQGWAGSGDAPVHSNHPLSRGERIVWMSDEGPEFGTVRWIGCLPDVPVNEITVGVEFDNPIGSGTGRYKNHRLFEARRNHASLVPILGLMKMSDYMPEAAASSSSFGIRTSSSTSRYSDTPAAAAVGYSGRSSVNSPAHEIELALQEVEKPNQRARQSLPIRGRVMPPSTTSDAVDSLCGKERGLQGQSGSCGLESVMYALFAFSSCLDETLYEDPGGRNDLLVAIKKNLVENIVNPLRAVNYVSSDRIHRYSELISMVRQPDVCNVGVPQTDDNESSLGKGDDPGNAVRQVLSHMLGSRSLFTSLQSVSDCVLKIGEFDFSSTIESLQHALERIQFSSSRQQMAFFPFPVLVVELRRDELSAASSFGMIYPDPVIDISHIVVGFPKMCKICGGDAELQCGDCFSESKSDSSRLADATFCTQCFEMFHQHANRKKHRSVKLHQGVYAPKDFNPRSARMEIFAAVSRVGGHFVSFVKSGLDPDSPWLFYDGMAARAIVEGRGVFVPEVRQCREIGKCLVDFDKFSMTPFTMHSELFQNMVRGLRLCFYRPLHSEASS